MFGLKHIVILAVCSVYIVFFSVFLKRKRFSLKTVLHCLLGVGVLSETLKIFTYIILNEAEYGRADIFRKRTCPFTFAPCILFSC